MDMKFTRLGQLFFLLSLMIFINAAKADLKIKKRNLLTKNYSVEKLKQIIIPKDEWRPYPKAGEMESWQVVPESVRNAHIKLGKKYLNFIIYYDGQPLIIDVSAATYNAKTFSRYRYEIWNMQSAFHNLPTINGVMQQNGRPYAAKNVKFEAENDHVLFSLDIAAAYPAAAKVKSWIRNIRLNRNKNVVISEKYELEKWEQPFTLNYMTPLQVEIVTPGKIQFTDSKSDVSTILYLEFNSNKFRANVEAMKLKDNRLLQGWGAEINRIVLKSASKLLADDFTIKISN